MKENDVQHNTVSHNFTPLDFSNPVRASESGEYNTPSRIRKEQSCPYFSEIITGERELHTHLS